MMTMWLSGLLWALVPSTLAEVPQAERTELAGLPAFGYSTDNGLGLGILGNVARFSPEHDPYRWKLYGLAKGNIKRAPLGGLVLTAYNGSLDLDTPGLRGGRLRLQLRVSAARGLDLAYYGLGNRNTATEPWTDEIPGTGAYDQARRYHLYERAYQDLTARGRIRLYDDPDALTRRRLEGILSMRALHHVLTPYPDSRLAEDLALAAQDTPDGATVASLLHGTAPHALLTLGTGLLWDTRDHELVPLSGGIMAMDLIGGIGIREHLRYEQIRLDLRRYQALVGQWLSLAARLQGDTILGDAPLYVLDGSSDGFTIRGVRYRRYLGHIKVLGGAEVRSSFLPFTLLRQRFTLGAAAFLDGGRVWTALSPVTLGGQPIDGALWDVHTGVGGGIRLQWGEAFLIRFDRAISPSDGTTGSYLVIGQAF